VEIEWLILADSAEVVGNKLYLLGGGWDAITVHGTFPAVQPCAVAAAYRVPWSETNVARAVEIEIVDEDGVSWAKVTGQVQAGRPPNVPRGDDQRIQFAVRLNLQVEGPGGHVMIGRIEDRPDHRVPFNVVAGPPIRVPSPEDADPT